VAPKARPLDLNRANADRLCAQSCKAMSAYEWKTRTYPSGRIFGKSTAGRLSLGVSVLHAEPSRDAVSSICSSR
jgi:hypothetical protein